MRKFFLFLFLFLSVRFIYSHDYTVTPDYKGDPKSELAFGIGYGLGFNVITTIKSSLLVYEGPRMYEVYSSPVWTIDYHRPIQKLISLGFAVSYQNIKIGYSENSSISNYNLEYHRVNIGLRPMVYLPTSKHLSFFIGVRGGATLWSFTSDDASSHLADQQSIPVMISGQIFLGLRYVFRNIGIGFESGFGTAPYLGQVHVFYRFQ